jgi:nucleoid-associated protein YgaU
MRSKNTILKNKFLDNVRYYGTTLYPLIEPKQSDIYVITTVGDRLDILAKKYYKDARLWWIIASSNNIPKDSIYVSPGTQLRIPTDLKEFNDSFNKINEQ